MYEGYVQDGPIWFAVDEMTDGVGNYVANHIVGKLGQESANRSYLLSSKVIDKVNTNTVAYFINSSIKMLYPNLDDNKVLLMFSDAASYMVSVGKIMPTNYPNIVHVTCLAHALHRVAEKIREPIRKLDPIVNKLISSVKKVFIKTPLRISHYKSKLPNVSLSPQPIITRWVTWLRAVEFYSQHLETIQQIINDFDSNDALSTTEAKLTLTDKTLRCNIIYITTNFMCIADAITKLETSKLDLCESIKIVTSLEENIKKARGPIGQLINKKYLQVLEKNPGYKILCTVSKIIEGKYTEIPEKVPMNNIPYFKFAPLTSVDVEHSFSAYKLIFDEKRRSYTPENLEKVLVTYCFSNYN